MTHDRILSLILLAALGVLSIAACDTGRIINRNSRVPCETTSECDAGLICAAGLCQPCRADIQCHTEYGRGYTCVSGSCTDPQCPTGTIGCACDEQGACAVGECINDVCVDCTRGAEDCVCFDNQTCLAGLRCNLVSMCEICPPGEHGCPCGDTDPVCDGELACVDDLCFPDPCPNGTLDCPCGDDDTCEDELVCADASICVQCSHDYVGCPCDTDNTCDNDLVCDQEDAICREPFTCAMDVCSPHQLCEDAVAGDPICLEDCSSGWLWDPSASQCVVPPPPSCAPDALVSIASLCASENRACIDNVGGAECGDCLPFWIEDGADCREVFSCTELTCGDENRRCVAATATSDATCGDCLDGFEVVAGVCLTIAPPNCDDGARGSITAECDTLHRVCVDPPTADAYCGGCAIGFADDGTGTCQPTSSCVDLDCAGRFRDCTGAPPFEVCGDCLSGFDIDPGNPDRCMESPTCSNVDCGPGKHCVDGVGGAPPTCATNRCQEGEAWSAWQNQCIDTCAVSCGGEGTTGAIWPFTLEGSTRCICETEPGYYWEEGDERGARPCDADGDGWVRNTARSWFESTDPALQKNARCEVRVIDRFVLRNEYNQTRKLLICFGDTPLVAATTDDVVCPEGPRALPLYETVRNDDDVELAASNDVAAYENDLGAGTVGRRLTTRELNSLTRACVNVAADFNGNSLSDLSEWHGMPPGDLSDDEQIFASLSYFIELHRGTYESGAEYGRYVIAERSRCALDGVAGQIPFPLTYGDGASEYWRECTRSRDAAYDPSDGAFGPEWGMDFARWSCDAETGSCPIPPPPITPPNWDTGVSTVIPHGTCALPDGVPPADDVWRGMSHHAQFRCVVVSDEDVTSRSTLSLAELASGGHVLNACAATDTEEAFDNPSSPVIDCVVKTASEGDVGFVAMGFLGPGTYQRGCIDEWAPKNVLGQATEDAEVSAWRALCPGWSADSSYGAAGITGQGDPNGFGEIQCGCGTSYGGPQCETGCPWLHLHVGNTDGQPYRATPRDGFWMCGDFAATAHTSVDTVAGPALVGPGGADQYTVYGGISLHGADVTPLCEQAGCGDGFVLR